MRCNFDLDGQGLALFCEQFDLLVNKSHQALHLVQNRLKLSLHAGLLLAR